MPADVPDQGSMPSRCYGISFGHDNCFGVSIKDKPAMSPSDNSDAQEKNVVYDYSKRNLQGYKLGPFSIGITTFSERECPPSTPSKE
ncbi:hypothetical protein EMPS_04127 [Entomortierella parvispora]|uniref:Uncharacterized protein n=1 Tax=Entomortierella parvispora TaxID=205924 RepID=A0A9P3LVI2_9FUNG|nr:hypothetical protein EMPS_04127 [Entomortierella parvispora]